MTKQMKTERPALSIIIPTLNEADSIQKPLEAVARIHGQIDSSFRHCLNAARSARVNSGVSNFNMHIRYEIKFTVFTGLLLLSAITTQAQLFSTDTAQIQFGPTEVPAGVTWSPSVSLRDGGLYAEKLPPNMAGRAILDCP